MDKILFLKKYRISEEDFIKSRCDWNHLVKIKSDYETWTKTLETPAMYFAESLRIAEKVHSVKLRIKNPEHLIEKIIRIQKEDSKLNISVGNYRNCITDLIGIRVLHLFKEDWTDIHKFIIETWKTKNKPTAYYRQGDNLRLYEDNGCKTSKHGFGYRSVHYLLESKPSKIPILVEVQVRTIFEEAWSEIDHAVRYPYDVRNILLANYLEIFNRLAGNADEMGSYVRLLKDQIYIKEEGFRNEIRSKNDTINKLQEKISQLEIGHVEKEELQKELEELKKKEMEFSPYIALSPNTLAESNIFGPLSSNVLGIDPSINSDEFFLGYSDVNLGESKKKKE